MRLYTRLLFLLILCCKLSTLFSQNESWMLGTWKGSHYSHTSQIASKTIVVDSIGGNTFSGTKTTEADDRNRPTITNVITGSIDNNNNVHVAIGKVLFKRDPIGGRWVNCGGCPVETRLSIVKKNLVLTIEISDCDKGCNGISEYYKPLCDFDSSLQVSLVKRFGTQSDIEGFSPCFGETPPPDEEKPNKDSLKNASLIAKKKQQQTTDSISNAQRALKKKQQQESDSANNAEAAIRKQQQRTADSLQAIADAAKKLLQQQLQDSIKNAQNIARIRQQQIADSVSTAKKRLQYVEDSIKTAQAIAARRQQQIDDSLKTVADLAKKRELQRQQDSITEAQRLARIRQQQVADSIKQADALAKKRQQQIDDSISVAKALALKEQQRINDSINLAKARINDSINAAKAFALREQKRISDSINQAKLTAMKRQQQVDDSLRNVLNAAIKKQKQQQQDSIKQAQALAKIKQQQEDSIKRAQAIAAKIPPVTNPPEVTVSTKKDSAKLVATNNAFNTRTNVLLESYHITTPDILVELFDNAEIDGDKVSVFHNGTLIVNNKTLAKEPITFTIHADTANRQHEFVMVAENLGTIPPNTALMRVTVGKQRYSLGVKTDLSTNAKIVFYYDGN